MLTWICISFRRSNDGDFCAVDVKKMEVSHWSKKVHLGSSFAECHDHGTRKDLKKNIKLCSARQRALGKEFFLHSAKIFF